jgi:hypothetical protein
MQNRKHTSNLDFRALISAGGAESFELAEA